MNIIIQIPDEEILRMADEIMERHEAEYQYDLKKEIQRMTGEQEND